MPTPLDVQGTITLKTALIIAAIVAAGLVFAFTPVSVIGYILLAIAAALYVFVSVRAGSR
jgi:Ca2+/Na+ antiporter